MFHRSEYDLNVILAKTGPGIHEPLASMDSLVAGLVVVVLTALVFVGLLLAIRVLSARS